MCLKLSNQFRTDEPLVAKKDILVYKLLDYSEETGHYCTPFQYRGVYFENGSVCMTSDIVLDKNRNVNIGLHAYFTIDAAKFVVRMFDETDVYFAVIPKGSKFYLGTENDIVSNNLIIFKTEYYYRKYCKENGLREKIGRKKGGSFYFKYDKYFSDEK